MSEETPQAFSQEQVNAIVGERLSRERTHVQNQLGMSIDEAKAQLATLNGLVQERDTALNNVEQMRTNLSRLTTALSLGLITSAIQDFMLLAPSIDNVEEWLRARPHMVTPKAAPPDRPEPEKSKPNPKPLLRF